MATNKKSEPAVEVSVAKKMLALSAKLATAPISQQQSVSLRFAQPVPTVPRITLIDEPTMEKMLDQIGVDPMILARKFMAIGNNSQGLTAQQVYSTSPFMWPHSADGPSGIIACVKYGDLYIASGLASIMPRAANGFSDHLVQVNGRVIDGVTLAKPNSKVPALPRGLFDKPGANGDVVSKILSGFAVTECTDPPSDGIKNQYTLDLPSIVIAAGKSSTADAADDNNPFADLDGWI